MPKHASAAELGSGGDVLLETLGLGPEAEMVYRLLLSKPEWQIGDFAEHLGVDEEQVRESLDRLVELELLTSVDGHRLVPVDPAVGLTVLLKRNELELSLRRRRLELTQQTVDALVRDLGRYEEATDEITPLHGLEAVRLRLEQVAITAQRECLSFFPGVGRRPAPWTPVGLSSRRP